jgi:hypothetical protein
MNGSTSKTAALLVALMALLLLQGLGRLVPPLQSPDELSHMVRIASLTEGQWKPVTPAGFNTGGNFDVALAALSRTYVPLIRERDPDVPQAYRDSARTQGWLHQSAFGEAPGSAVYLPVVYAPAAAGLALGRSLGWSVLESYHLARLASQLACAALVGLAVWIWAPPLLAWTVLLLPMSLFQLVSPVVDGPAHALTLFVLSLFMRLWSEGPPRSRGWAWVWCAALVVLVTSRMHLAPLLLLPLALLWQHRSARWAGLWLVCVVATGAWVAWVLGSVVDHRVQRDLSTGQVLLYYLMHPMEAWEVFERTVTEESRLGFLYDSFIGNLGWLDTRLADAAYVDLGWALMAAAVLSLPFRPAGIRTLWARLLLVFGAVASVLLAFALMLLTWSPFPTQMIEGVQGRYFIAPALMVAYGLGRFERPASVGTSAQPRWTMASNALAVASFGALSLFYLWPTLMARYPEWARSSLWVVTP